MHGTKLKMQEKICHYIDARICPYIANNIKVDVMESENLW